MPFDSESDHWNAGLRFQVLSGLRLSRRKIEQRIKKPVGKPVLSHQKKPQRRVNFCRSDALGCVGMRWLKVVGSDARRALPRVPKSMQHEGRGWLILNVTITCLQKELDGCQLTPRSPPVNLVSFFGCRVFKGDRWYGRVFAGISKFIKGCFNHNSLKTLFPYFTSTEFLSKPPFYKNIRLVYNLL